MRDDAVPFRFDVRDTLGRLKAMGRVKGVSIRLPGVSLNVEVDDVERRVAREIVIRLADRRVLNSRECCDTCISNALSSIEKIRILLVDQQVELSDHADRPLYLLIEFALEGVRQFLTFQERSLRHAQRLVAGVVDEHSPFPEVGYVYRQQYLWALELLRSHIFRTLQQIARTADLEIPTILPSMRYDDDWSSQQYLLAGEP